jgi:hypothetical protein
LKKGTKFLSLSIKAKDAPVTKKSGAEKSAPEKRAADFDDTIPF